MSQTEDGGPAFAPYGAPHPTDPSKAIYGMSLRDYFAAQFLCGQLAFSPRDSFEKIHMPDDVAERAYLFADAMLRAR